MAGLTKLGQVDIQFGRDWDAEKARRLVEELQNTENALNGLIDIVATLQANSNPGTVAPHVLATEVGLGPDHTTSGLKAGEVLKALSATTAAFRRLKFSDLDQTDISDTPAQDDVLQFIDGYWVNGPFDTTGLVSDAENEGTGARIFIAKGAGVLMLRTLKSGPGVTVVEDSEEILISADGSVGGGDGYPAALGFAGIL